MSREFLIGARCPHEGEMLRLGLRQLAEAEEHLKGLLAAYEQTRTPILAQQITEECVFISQTLDAAEELASSGSTSSATVIAGRLLEVSGRLRELLEEAGEAISGRHLSSQTTTSPGA